MITGLFDLMLEGKNIETENIKEGAIIPALMWIVWFSIMLYLTLSVI
tara:strand:- start:1262 stop:1402 length:141 start_codon:yes stop_codon:yes gene_type:complete